MRWASYLLFCVAFAATVNVMPVFAGEPFAIVELFTSQGCSSCPAADQVFHQLVKQARQSGFRVYFLGFHIDYWDGLGWKDPFSSPEFTKRQYKYANVLGAKSAYTPQMIINGRQAFLGSDRGKARRFIKIYLEVPAANTLTLNVARRDYKKVEISYECDRLGGDALIHFALLESGLETKVASGENRGRLLKNDHVVRDFQTFPLDARGKAVLNVPAGDPEGTYEVVVYVQDPADMRIYAAERVVLD